MWHAAPLNISHFFLIRNLMTLFDFSNLVKLQGLGVVGYSHTGWKHRLLTRLQGLKIHVRAKLKYLLMSMGFITTWHKLYGQERNSISLADKDLQIQAVKLNRKGILNCNTLHQSGSHRNIMHGHLLNVTVLIITSLTISLQYTPAAGNNTGVSRFVWKY